MSDIPDSRSLVPDPLAVPDDRELAAQAARGDVSAFEVLVRLYQSPLYCYLHRMCRNPAEAEEYAQETFIKAWQGLPGFRADSSFKTWLFRIGTNLCINRLSRRRPTEPLPETLAAPDCDQPEIVHHQHVREERVRAALDRLPADQRSAVILSIYEEMSYGEIAEAMGRSVASVNALLYRARMNLRRHLEDAYRRGSV